MLPLQADKPNLEIINNLKQTIMKKFFTLIAAVAMAASVNAQSFTFDTEFAAGAAPESITSNGIKLTITNSASAAVDKNSQYFGTKDSYKNFTTRFKTGGKSTSTKNYLTLTVPSDGTLNVYVRTGSSSATNRNIVLAQGETELLNKVILESDAVTVPMGTTEVKDTKVFPVVSTPVKKGDVSIKYPEGSMYIYGFELVTTTGVSSVSVAEAKAKTASFNLAGQKVSDSYKGIVVKNGKKYLNK